MEWQEDITEEEVSEVPLPEEKPIEEKELEVTKKKKEITPEFVINPEDDFEGVNTTDEIPKDKEDQYGI